MILFVFEGKDDKTYFESIKQLFFPEKPDTFGFAWRYFDIVIQGFAWNGGVG